jgi:hypothetical protein
LPGFRQDGGQPGAPIHRRRVTALRVEPVRHLELGRIPQHGAVLATQGLRGARVEVVLDAQGDVLQQRLGGVDRLGVPVVVALDRSIQTLGELLDEREPRLFLLLLDGRGHRADPVADGPNQLHVA